MGNLVTGITTIFTPLIVKEGLIPMLYHPYRWGGIPFTAPSTTKLSVVYLLLTFLIIGTAATISGMMTTLHECDKVSLLTALNNSKWVLVWAFIGLCIINVFPFIKAPLLVLIPWVPYSNQIANGIYLAIFTMIGGIMGNSFSRQTLCNV